MRSSDGRDGTMSNVPRIRHLGMVEYEPTWQAMRDFTLARTSETPDEIWLLQHPPTYTLGLNGKPEHILQTNEIPIVKIDRGGQVTYHGPGQIVVYLLLDIRRLNLGVRALVRLIEQAVVELLAEYGLVAAGRIDAPGVYIEGAKIAALGLRIRSGCCYHGLSLNVDMDLSPFKAINPCGYPGLQVTRTKDLGVTASIGQLGEQLTQHLLQQIYK